MAGELLPYAVLAGLLLLGAYIYNMASRSRETDRQHSPWSSDWAPTSMPPESRRLHNSKKAGKQDARIPALCRPGPNSGTSKLKAYQTRSSTANHGHSTTKLTVG